MFHSILTQALLAAVLLLTGEGFPVKWVIPKEKVITFTQMFLLRKTRKFLKAVSLTLNNSFTINEQI